MSSGMSCANAAIQFDAGSGSGPVFHNFSYVGTYSGGSVWSMQFTNSVPGCVSGENLPYTLTTSYVSNNLVYTQAQNGTEFAYCTTSSCSPPPITPTMAFYFPVNGTTTPDFSTWEFSLTNVSTTDEYRSVVQYGLGQGVFTDQNYFYPNYSSGVTPLNKSVALAAYGSSTSWTAQGELYDVTEGDLLVATTTVITFNVNSATSTYTGIYSTSTFPVPIMPGVIASETAPFATSTCAWGDVGCAIGNVADNVLNFIFGINDAEISQIAGFNLATQQPFAVIPEIQNDFANVTGSTTIMASSSMTMNLGEGNTSVAFFNPTEAQNYFGPAGPVVRGLILAVLTLLLIFGFYLEIKAIFKAHK